MWKCTRTRAHYTDAHEHISPKLLRLDELLKETQLESNAAAPL